MAQDRRKSFEGWMDSVKFEPKAIWTENFTPPTESYGKTSYELDGDSSFLSIPDTEDWKFSGKMGNFEAYMIPGDRLVFRPEIINRKFYRLKRLDYSDYYIIKT